MLWWRVWISVSGRIGRDDGEFVLNVSVDECGSSL